MAHKKEGKERISDPRVDKIWEYMREKKMNLKKLVDVTKLSYPHVCNMMNGRKALSYDVLEKIAQGLKLPMEYFLESLALNEGINMPINEQLLNDAKINWFGKVLHFTKDADGTVTVKAIARSNSPKSSLTEVIQHQAKKQKSISKGNL